MIFDLDKKKKLRKAYGISNTQLFSYKNLLTQIIWVIAREHHKNTFSSLLAHILTMFVLIILIIIAGGSIFMLQIFQMIFKNVSILKRLRECKCMNVWQVIAAGILAKGMIALPCIIASKLYGLTSIH